MNEVIDYLNESITFIRKTWLTRYDNTTSKQRETARKWITAIKQDIETIKNGKSSITLDMIHESEIWINEYDNELKLQTYCNQNDIDRDLINYHQLIDYIDSYLT